MNTRITHFYTAAAIVLTSSIISAETLTKNVTTLEPHVISIVESQRGVIDALASVKAEKDLPLVQQAIDSLVAAITTTSSEAKKVGQLTLIEMNELSAVRSRREYELFPDRSINAEMTKVPEALKPKVMGIFQASMKKLIEAQSSLESQFSTDTGESSHRVETLRVDLEKPFVAVISFGNATDAWKDPVTFVEVAVLAEDAKDGSSLELYTQQSPWAAPTPTKEALGKWINYDKAQRLVEFKLPDRKFNYKLPRKAEQDGAGQAATRPESK